ncbi:hypothetical protein [Desulfobacter latus]|uniref:Uncharacterized protein n=1 Tax=Desulfobacter latus TaxID=2292 RepID=A0A850T4U3_9BACT|nr:hypothetical protein [Desulfobacter latus]NWH03875.1 hypothetical protein [Desulfobacter latus]
MAKNSSIDELRSEIKRNKKQHARDLENLRREQQKSAKQHFNALNQQVHDIGVRFDSDLRQLETQVGKDFEQFNKEVTGRLTAQRKQFQKEMEKNRNVLQGQIDELTNRIAGQYDAAGQWIQAVEDEMDEMRRNNDRVDFFFPGELRQIEQNLQLAKKNLSSNSPEAALATAQERFLELQELRENVEAMTREWHYRLTVVSDLLKRQQQILDDNRSIEVESISYLGIDLSGYDHQETDYWSNGQWSTLQNEIKKNQSKLNNNDISIDDLKKMQERVEENLQQSLLLVGKAARLCFACEISSRLQHAIYDEMKNKGFEQIFNSYRENDNRQDNYLVLAGPIGEKLSVVLSPDMKGDSPLPEIHIFYQNSNLTRKQEDQEKQKYSEKINTCVKHLIHRDIRQGVSIKQLSEADRGKVFDAGAIESGRLKCLGNSV